MITYLVFIFPVFSALLFSGCGSANHTWKAAHYQNHPWVGQVVSEKQNIQLEQASWEGLKSAEIILIGETHDHPDHHKIQAQIIAQIAPRSVAFEMINQDQQTQLDQLYNHPPNKWDQLLQWSKRGWPDFKLYRPVFEAAQKSKSTLIAAHPNAQVIYPLKLGKALDSQLIQDLKLDYPLEDNALKELQNEIKEAHCGYAPPVMLTAMVSAQRLKDAWMARALIEAPKPVVLIVGRGHTLNSRGIPWALKILGSTFKTKVVSLNSVWPKKNKEPAPVYTSESTFQVYTPAHRIDDPCERFKEKLKQMKMKHPHHSKPSSSPKALLEKTSSKN